MVVRKLDSYVHIKCCDKDGEEILGSGIINIQNYIKPESQSIYIPLNESLYIINILDLVHQNQLMIFHVSMLY